jgi:hypothetical protein
MRTTIPEFKARLKEIWKRFAPETSARGFGRLLTPKTPGTGKGWLSKGHAPPQAVLAEALRNLSEVRDPERLAVWARCELPYDAKNELFARGGNQPPTLAATTELKVVRGGPVLDLDLWRVIEKVKETLDRGEDALPLVESALRIREEATKLGRLLPALAFFFLVLLEGCDARILWPKPSGICNPLPYHLAMPPVMRRILRKVASAGKRKARAA